MDLTLAGIAQYAPNSARPVLRLIGSRHGNSCPRADHARLKFLTSDLLGMRKTRSYISCTCWRSVTVNRRMMMNFKLIGAAALSLVLATPAMAMHHRYHHDYSQATDGKSSVQSAYGAYNFAPRDDEGRSDFPAYDPVPPSANGG
jgi:hypothetical protein